ncbi:hypothetical protein F0402_18225, partial [Mycolicibacter arupensis]
MSDHAVPGSDKDGQQKRRDWSAGPTVNDTEIFFRHPCWLRATNLSLATQSVYVTLDYFDFNDKGSTWHSVETISRWAGVSRRTVYESMRILERLGLIRTEPQYRKDGGRMSNKHHFIPPDEKQRGWIGSLSEKEIRALARDSKALDKTPGQSNGSNSLPACLRSSALPPCARCRDPLRQSALPPCAECKGAPAPAADKGEELQADQAEADNQEADQQEADEAVPHPGGCGARPDPLVMPQNQDQPPAPGPTQALAEPAGSTHLAQALAPTAGP